MCRACATALPRISTTSAGRPLASPLLYVDVELRWGRLMVSGSAPRRSVMATLISQSSKLQIARKPSVAGIYAVTAHVKLHLNSDDINLLKAGQKFVVTGSIMGSDGGFNG